jgi:hypothetical protein
VKRTLALKHESLAELSTDDLGAVAGGQAPPTLPLADCLDTFQATRCFCP